MGHFGATYFNGIVREYQGSEIVLNNLSYFHHYPLNTTCALKVLKFETSRLNDE